MQEMMLDIETLGRKAGCAILSIGAVMFNSRTDEIGNPFYCNIDLTTSMMAGFSIEKETLEWWRKQEKAAQDALSQQCFGVAFVINNFKQFCETHKVEKIWCQGVAFDIPIIEAAFHIVGIEVPWKYNAPRDTRTAYDICGFDTKSITREGVYHNAVDDCKHQIKCVQAAIKGAK